MICFYWNAFAGFIEVDGDMKYLVMVMNLIK